MTASIILLIGVTFVAMMSPGPDMVLILKNSATGNRMAPPACIMGIAAGLVVHVTLAVLGLSVLFQTNPSIYMAARLLGAAYLVYVGVMTFRDSGGLSLKNADGADDKTVRQAFREGLFCNLLNPKVTIFILSVFTQLVDFYAPVAQKFIFGGVIIVESIIVWNLFALVMQTPALQRLLQKHQSAVNRGIGVILVAFAATLVFRG